MGTQSDMVFIEPICTLAGGFKITEIEIIHNKVTEKINSRQNNKQVSA